MSSIDETITRILKARTIAAVGLSRNLSKLNHRVASYLQSLGYCVILVNRTIDEALVEKSYRSLLELPDSLKRQIAVVDLFRRPQHVSPIVDQAIALCKKYGKPSVIWMRLGMVNGAVAAL
jgi:predicted CoA-binding protein